MSTPTTQQQWDHAKFETLHAAYDAVPSKEAADDLISKCIEWGYEYHKADQEECEECGI